MNSLSPYPRLNIFLYPCNLYPCFTKSLYHTLLCPCVTVSYFLFMYLSLYLLYMYPCIHVSLYLFISASMHLRILVSLNSCIHVSLYLFISVSLYLRNPNPGIHVSMYPNRFVSFVSIYLCISVLGEGEKPDAMSLCCADMSLLGLLGRLSLCYTAQLPYNSWFLHVI